MKNAQIRIFSGPYFPVFGLNKGDLRSKSPYSVRIHEKCPNTGKYGPEKTPYLDTFQAVCR